MPLDTRDDCIHPIGQEPTWREAFYFDFFDPQTRLCAFGYSGVHPNQQIGDVIFALWRDGTPLLEPLPIPAFRPERWVSRWGGVVI